MFLHKNRTKDPCEEESVTIQESVSIYVEDSAKLHVASEYPCRPNKNWNFKRTKDPQGWNRTYV